MAWLLVLRPLGQANIAPFVLLGCALGVSVRGHLEPLATAGAIALGLLVHAVVILGNEHGDWEADMAFASPTLVSGGSGVARTGALERGAVGRAGLLATLALLLAGAALLPSHGPGPLVGASLAAGLSWSYSHPPLRLAYRGLGPLLQGAGVGVVLPLLGFAVQAGRSSGLPWEALAPTFLLGAAGNTTTSLPDLEADRAANKLSPAVLLGRRGAQLTSVLLTTLAIALVPLTSPEAHPGRLLLTLAAAGGAVIIALLLVIRGRRGRTMLFVYAQSAASMLLLGGWCWSLLR